MTRTPMMCSVIGCKEPGLSAQIVKIIAERDAAVDELDRICTFSGGAITLGVERTAELAAARADLAALTADNERLRAAIKCGARYDEPNAEPCFCMALTAQAVHSGWCGTLRAALAEKQP